MIEAGETHPDEGNNGESLGCLDRGTVYVSVKLSPQCRHGVIRLALRHYETDTALRRSL